ncbi:MAG: class I SAM-dependent methyltransferase [Phycisphaerae bacterium]
MRLDRIRKFYARQAPLYDLTRRLFLFSRKAAVDALELKEADRVLDIGCGTGLNFPFILRKVKADNVVGIDSSPEMLAMARRKYRLKLVDADAANYRFGEQFDKIISSYAISIMDDWEKVLANASGCLRPGGIFVILDFSRWTRARAAYRVFKWWLNRHGVDPERDPAPVLRRYFQDVQTRVLHCGYNSIVVARDPR